MVRRRGRQREAGSTVAVVGDGAVGLLAILAASQMGAERIIGMSRHPARQTLAREFGATDVVTERGEEGAARIHEITKGSARTRCSSAWGPSSRCSKRSAPRAAAGT